MQAGSHQAISILFKYNKLSKINCKDIKFNTRSSMRRRITFLLAVSSLALIACTPQEPIRIGFIGGLSDRNADNGQSGHNAVILAVEQFNRAGGLNGRMMEIVARDDAQNKEAAARAAHELVDAGVDAIIGPFTSSMAEVVQPITSQAGILEISPTITSMAFYGKDDNLIRINRTTRDNAREYAAVLSARGQRKIAVGYDLRNRSFSESWLAEFQRAFTAHGGSVAKAVPYESAPDANFGQVVAEMLSAAPDGLLFIAGGLDVARLAQQARKQAKTLPISASEWASTEQLLELGGDVIEGLLIVQNYDHGDTSAQFRTFSEAYFKRFQRNPGYSSVSAYDAMTVLLTALRQRKNDESLKSAVLRLGPYPGLQQPIAFDANGDTERRVFSTERRGGRHVKLPQAEQGQKLPAGK